MKYKNYNLYAQDVHTGDAYRKEYVSSIERLLERKFLEGQKNRTERFSPPKLAQNTEACRNEYLKMIGFPFDLVSEEIPSAKCEYVGDDDLSKIYRIQVEVASDFLFYGILMVPNGIKKAPLVIAQHGGGGTPEFCSDMAGENHYNFFTKRALERGCVVFCPSLLLWCFENIPGWSFPRIEIPADRVFLNSRLNQIGYSMTGLEIFCIMRSLDWLCTLRYVDQTRIGMLGLSYGGYFSLHTAAADPRIVSVYDAASFNDRGAVLGENDWSYANAANLYFDAEVAGLIAPRKLRIDVGRTDEVFDYHASLEEAERARAYYAYHGALDNFCFNLWDGGHRFDETLSGFAFFFSALE